MQCEMKAVLCATSKICQIVFSGTCHGALRFLGSFWLLADQFVSSAILIQNS